MSCALADSRATFKWPLMHCEGPGGFMLFKTSGDAVENPIFSHSLSTPSPAILLY